MPREIALGDALVPGLLVLFVVSLALLWLLDWVAGRFGLYRLVWHPPLFRLACSSVSSAALRCSCSESDDHENCHPDSFCRDRVVVLVAIVVAHALWKHYMYSPWTRDGRVRAEIVRIAPDVSGLVTQVNVIDNQTVKKGELLFVIDRARYQNAFDLANANLGAAQAAARAAGRCRRGDRPVRHKASRATTCTPRNPVVGEQLNDVISAEDRANAQSAANDGTCRLATARRPARSRPAPASSRRIGRGDPGEGGAGGRAAQPRSHRSARANRRLRHQPRVRVGDYASVGVPRLALIDSHSYWIYGYFEETKLPQVHVGDSVDIRLMSGGVHLHGSVESIARGITDAANPTGSDLLSDVNPTFNWVRLAQRVPVRVSIDTDHMPAGTVLAAGMTATLIVHPHRSAVVASR
jgi:multidrug resistance efflux pump